jgi:hypothetical protein
MQRVDIGRVTFDGDLSELRPGDEVLHVWRKYGADYGELPRLQLAKVMNVHNGVLILSNGANVRVRDDGVQRELGVILDDRTRRMLAWQILFRKTYGDLRDHLHKCDEGSLKAIQSEVVSWSHGEFVPGEESE